MTHCIVTNSTDPINVGSCRGSITALKLKVWPGWERHFGVIATYVWKSKQELLLVYLSKTTKLTLLIR